MEEFYKQLDKHIESLNKKFREKFCIKQILYDNIVLVLRDVTIGDQKVVYEKKSNLPVITYENLYGKINECHIRVGHHGRDKTWVEVKDQYAWIPFHCIKLYISQCDVCCNRKAFPKPLAEKPIVSIGYLTRVQMDLIDLRSIGDGEFQWILHIKDHFSKFSWAYPLCSKEAQAVAEKLLQQFYLFGVPKILQSDNGKEFVAKVIKDLKNIWPDLVIINGRPRHPQTQGLVERGNQTLESALGKWMDENKRKDWSKALPHAIFSINTSSAQTTKKSPFEVVFGQKARPNTEMWKLLNSQGVVDEEDLPSEIINQLNECGDLTNVKDTSTADENEPSTSQIQELQPAPLSPVRALQLQPASFSPVYATPPTNKRRRARLTSKDDYVVVSFDEQSDNDDPSPVTTNHNQIRSEAEASYMATIAKRQKLFDDAQNRNDYKIGDLVGLKIDRIDRTHVTPKILPCKIISIKSTSGNVNTYELCTTTCIISSWFQAIDLLNLTECNFRDLRDVDPTGLPNMTFIQACKECVKITLVTPTKACNCNGNCSTKKCYCRAAKVPCSTKWHSMKPKSCSNM